MRCIKNQGRACASDCVIIKEKYLLFMRRLLPGVKIILFLAFGFLIGLGIRAGLSWFDPTAAPPALNSPPPINVSDSVQIKEGGLNIATVSGNVGVGTTTPASLLSVGSSSQFQVDSSGNLVRINNIPYSWPSFQGGGDTFLQNDGAGNLSWAIGSSGGANLLFTRTPVLNSASNATKDAQCNSEFGANYHTAHVIDVAGYATMGLSANIIFTTYDSATYSWLLTASPVTNQFTYIDATSAAGSYAVACVKKDALLRFTRASLAATATLSSKDAQCQIEFGSSYQTAGVRDIAGNATFGVANLSITSFLAAENSGDVSYFFADTTNDLNYLAYRSPVTQVPVACIRTN